MQVFLSVCNLWTKARIYPVCDYALPYLYHFLTRRARNYPVSLIFFLPSFPFSFLFFFFRYNSTTRIASSTLDSYSSPRLHTVIFSSRVLFLSRALNLSRALTWESEECKITQRDAMLLPEGPPPFQEWKQAGK